MRTVDYSEVLWGSAALAGLGREDIGTAELALFRTFHDRRLQAAWELERWPEICPVEERQFRQDWDAVTTYAAGDERFDTASGNYFQSLQAGNLNNPPTTLGVENSAFWAACRTSYGASDWIALSTYAVGGQVRNPSTGLYYQCITAHTAGATIDLTKFGLLTGFDRYVGYTQTGRTAVGEFFYPAYDRNPKLTTKSVKLPFWLSENGAQFTQVQKSVVKVWLEFRRRRPVLTGVTWDSASVYTSGQQVYYLNAAESVANFYTANQTTVAAESPESAAAKWDVVQLPYIFRGYLIEAGFADWLTGDGQDSKARGHEQLALGYLELEVDKLTRQSGQARRFRIEC